MVDRIVRQLSQANQNLKPKKVKEQICMHEV